MPKTWREIKDMVQLGFAQEWHSCLKELDNIYDDSFDHRDLSIWKYVHKSLESLDDIVTIDTIVADYDPHPTLLHAMFCDIRLILFDFQFAKYLESRLSQSSMHETATIHQTFKNGDPDRQFFEEWRNTYGLVHGRSVDAKGGLRSAPWLKYLYEHSAFRDEDYEKAFLDFGYHRARPVETLGRLELHLCGLIGGKPGAGEGAMRRADERWRHLALCSSSYHWLRLAPM